MRILVVEDEANIAEYLRRSLCAEGFTVDVATTGDEGLTRALEGCYDAITLDIMLPGMNGYDVCRSIRAAGIATPVLMLTAKDGEYDEADAFDIGADDFLRKPFSLVVLIARLRSLIRRSASSHNAGQTLSVGDLTLDTTTHEVRRAGTIIDLTPREYQLLEYLMHNQGVALPKSQILEHVWGPDFALDENVVEVYTGYLRKKLGGPDACPLIHTIRGVGYRMGEK